MTAPPSALLDVSDLVVTFRIARLGRGAKLHAVDGVSLRVDRAETLGLVGESGSGKTSAGRAILQLNRVSSGTVLFDGLDVMRSGREGRRQLRRNAQMIFQDPLASLNAKLKVGQIIQEPLNIHRIGDHAARRARVSELVEMVGLPADAVRRYPHEFSGGQCQRIGIARALAMNPSLVICDEPVTALDVSVQAQILQLLKTLQRQTGVAYLFIAHDLNVVRHMASRVAVMYLGKIIEEGPCATVFAEPRHPYTQALISAIPVPDPEAPKRQVMMRGEIPSPTNPPSGCRFRTRCPHAKELCATQEPALEPIGDDTAVACHYWRDIAPAATAERPTTATPGMQTKPGASFAGPAI